MTQIRSCGISALLLTACPFLIQPAFSATAPTPYTATLAWDRSPDSSVTGYRVYFGTTARKYTNSIVAGNAMNLTISGLANGATYYFAVTAYDAGGDESDFSNEVKVVPGQLRPSLQVAPVNEVVPGQLRVGLRLALTKEAVLTVNGLVGHTYDILASTNLTTWSVIGSAMLNASGAQDFTDTNAASFPKRFYQTRETKSTNEVSAPSPLEATVQIIRTSRKRAVLSVTGVPGQAYDIQATSDSTIWTTLGRVFLDRTGTKVFVDRNRSSHHHETQRGTGLDQKPKQPYLNRTYRAIAVTP